MTATVFKRETCRLCDSSNVDLVVNLEPIPLSERYTDNAEDGKNADRFPVDLYMCKDCGHVQHFDVIDSEALWDNYTYESANANGMPEHFADIRDQVVERFNPEKGSLVIDIGSNDGSLLRVFKDVGHEVLGIDPATEVARKATESGIPTLPELMSLDLAKEIKEKHGQASVITAFNVYAHADNLGEMTDAIRELLAPGGIFVFEAQYLMDIIDGKLIATIFHEHMSHHSVKPMIKFLDAHGLELITAARNPNIQHGSLIGMVQVKGGQYKVDDSVAKMVAEEDERALDKIETLRDFDKTLTDQKNRMMAFMDKIKSEGATVAGYGAARSGPTLISQMGLTGSIDFIVDDHPAKIGKYSSGDGIFIHPTAELCEKMPDYTVILAWVHSKNIIKKSQDYLDKGGKFIVLCPEMRVVSKDKDELL